MRKCRATGRHMFSAFFACAGLLAGALQVSAESPLEKALKEGKALEAKNKALLGGIRPTGEPSQAGADVRRQKEEAAESLNKTIMLLDDREKAKAIGALIK